MWFTWTWKNLNFFSGCFPVILTRTLTGCFPATLKLSSNLKEAVRRSVNANIGWEKYTHSKILPFPKYPFKILLYPKCPYVLNDVVQAGRLIDFLSSWTPPPLFPSERIVRMTIAMHIRTSSSSSTSSWPSTSSSSSSTSSSSSSSSSCPKNKTKGRVPKKKRGKSMVFCRDVRGGPGRRWKSAGRGKRTRKSTDPKIWQMRVFRIVMEIFVVYYDVLINENIISSHF